MVPNDYLNLWSQAFVQAFNKAIAAVIAFLPNLFSAFFVFFLGVLVARWTRSLILKSFSFFKLDLLTKDAKIKKFLTEAEITQKVEEIIASFVRWVVLLVFSIAALNILGLTTISTLLYHLIAYLPNVISAVVVLTLGVLLAGVMESLVKGALATIDIHTSRLMGKITSYVVVVITILVAISELNIAQNFINILFIGFVVTLSLGFGLALGLGSKDLVAQILQDWYHNLKKDITKTKN